MEFKKWKTRGQNRRRKKTFDEALEERRASEWNVRRKTREDAHLKKGNTSPNSRRKATLEETLEEMRGLQKASDGK
ncbi:hypothetical protein V3C99_008510 [Haemonchus contortus]